MIQVKHLIFQMIFVTPFLSKFYKNRQWRLMDYISGRLENAGKDCWRKCNKRQGACEWCGSIGFCCTKKKEWNDYSNGCDGTFGGETMHQCALKPGKSN